MAAVEYPRLVQPAAASTPEGELLGASAVPLAAFPDSVAEVLRLAARAATDVGASDELRVLGQFLLHHGGATAAEYARDLRGFARWCSERDVALFSVDRTTVELWVLGLQAQGLQPRTIARRLAAVHGFYLEAIDAGVVERVPTLRVKRPRGARPVRVGIGREDSALLLEAAEDSGPRDEVIIRLLLLNGLRASEVIQLRVGDIGQERGHTTLTVRRKGGRTTVEACSGGTRDALHRLFPTNTGVDPAAPLVAGRYGRPLSRFSVARVTRRLGHIIGVGVEPRDPELNPHELRHSFITLGLDAGVSLRDMQRAAAHADPRTTADYDRRREALDTHPTYAVERYLRNRS